MALQLPEAFTRRMRTQLGGEFEAFLTALNAAPPVSLRLNPNKPGAEFSGAAAIPWCPEGRYLLERPQFFQDPLIYAGAYYVQEAASMLVGAFARKHLAARPGLRVLDLCAAPGGKTTLLASLLPEDALLVSNEIVGKRAQVLKEVVTRWGDPRIVVTCNHPRDFAGLENFFDLVVVDAPCSGEGMFRKDPAVIGAWKPALVQQCAERQRDILRAILPTIKRPHGKLIYSTCTYSEDENEAIVDWVLARKSSPQLLPTHRAEWGLAPGRTDGYAATLSGAGRCYPHRLKGEGFFVSCLQFDQPEREAYRPRAPKKSLAKRNKKAGSPARQRPLTKADRKMAAEYLRDPEQFVIEDHTGIATAIPRDLTDDLRQLQQHLRVIKAGIALGKPKGGRLIPEHDLALSEVQAESLPLIKLERGEALRYLARDELKMDTGGHKGWAIVRYQNRNLGWVKVLDNRVNNHLPRHLKIRSDVSQLY